MSLISSATHNSDVDMSRVKDAIDMKREMEAGKWKDPQSGKAPRGLYGDSVGGRSFSDQQAALLETASKYRRAVGAGWREVWAGPGTTCWNVIDVGESTADDAALYEEILASDS